MLYILRTPACFQLRPGQPDMDKEYLIWRSVLQTVEYKIDLQSVIKLPAKPRVYST